VGVLLGGVLFRVHDGLLGAAAKIRRGVYPVVCRASGPVDSSVEGHLVLARSYTPAGYPDMSHDR
jgi:hypothetical protein